MNSPITDISKLRLPEEDILENSFDSIFIKRLPDLKVIYINRAPTEKIFGYSIDHFYKDNFHIWYKDDEQIYRSIIDRCVQDGIAEGRYRCLTKAGEIIWLHHRIKLLSSDEGSPLAIIGNCSNITNLVKLENIAISNARLASMADIAAGMAHEIKNPLQVISGNIEKLNRTLSDSRDPNIKKMFESINKAIARIVSIIDRVITFSKSSSNDNFEITSTNDLLEESIKFYGEKINSLQIDIRYQANKLKNPSIRVRRFQIEQAILNLIQNSIDAIQDISERWISIETKVENNKAAIIIKNSGPKIPSEITFKIMEPFFTTKEIGKGTGLGLSVARKILKEHGGELFYEEASGNTSFRIEIPIYSPSDLASQLKTQPN